MRTLLLACAALVVTTLASAQAVITLPGGQVSLGVGQLGALGAGSLPANSNAPGSEYGIYLAAQHADAIAPGCFCEGWGVAINGATSGYVGNDDGGTVSINGVSFSSTASTATAVTTLTGTSLRVTQAYAPSVANTVLFQDTVTLTNTSSTAALHNVEYTRSMDWDINPTEFNEIVSIGGVGATALRFSNDDGFCTPDPLAACSAILPGTTNTNFTKVGPADQGSFFTFNFGDLAPGASNTFDIYYGAGVNEAAAIGGLTRVGAEVYALGYASNGPGGTANVNSGVWAFGFTGVGGTPISGTPEPASLALAAAGLLGVIVARKKLKA